jgi:hypothetical protein
VPAGMADAHHGDEASGAWRPVDLANPPVAKARPTVRGPVPPPPPPPPRRVRPRVGPLVVPSTSSSSPSSAL